MTYSRNLRSDKGGSPQSWPPLWSIGLAVAVMLIVPFVLYAIAPAGPVREGDTVFASGRQTVELIDWGRYERAGYEQTCIVERRDPLIIVRRPSDRPDSLLVAQVQGKTKIEFPFCPPQAKVIVKPSQVIQKPDILIDIKDSLTRLFTRSR